MKPTKKELALEAERMKLYSACCWAIKGFHLNLTATATCKDTWFDELRSALGERHASAVVDFMETLL